MPSKPAVRGGRLERLGMHLGVCIAQPCAGGDGCAGGSDRGALRLSWYHDTTLENLDRMVSDPRPIAESMQMRNATMHDPGFDSRGSAPGALRGRGAAPAGEMHARGLLGRAAFFFRAFHGHGGERTGLGR